MSTTLAPEVAAGQAVYTPATLRVYDGLVHGLTNPLVWGCPTALLVDWHRRHVGGRHCEVGVGTGYVLQRARVRPRSLTLVDLNPHCLERTAHALQDLSPRCIRADVLQPLPVGIGPFDSIGLGYLLHCIPGRFDGAKGAALDHLGAALDGGVLFGSTVLGRSEGVSMRARALMALYNRQGIFHNRQDSLRGLIRALAERFDEHEVQRVGAVALFAARGYRGAQ